MDDRVIAPQQFGDDSESERTLRPKRLADFVGQKALKHHRVDAVVEGHQQG